ncbi:UNVERIFIED_CONTAM: Cytoplasmic FMR1-interacting protein 2 [Siphonaria sp. JEL0065]|nr:Cytoplasmic FMR1-interacting protein 2 [Siphonaria sp. JEL0065]
MTVDSQPEFLFTDYLQRLVNSEDSILSYELHCEDNDKQMKAGVGDGDPYKKSLCLFWIKQEKWMLQLVELEEAGRSLLWRLYSFRSPTRAIPQIPADATPDVKQSIHSLTYQMFTHSLARISELMTFRDTLVDVVFNVLSNVSLTLSTNNSLFVHSQFFVVLSKVLVVALEADEMKQLKNGLTNDLSWFRRVLTALGLPIKDSPKYQQMALFLANGDQFCGELKLILRQRVPRFEDILLDLIQTACDRIEAGTDIEMKHVWLKVFSLSFGEGMRLGNEIPQAIAISIQLIDDKTEELNILKRKKFKFAHVSKILNVK